jgi:ligand-binding sensor domain-containing protein/DNA-binding CsgD family transcriptional regulator
MKRITQLSFVFFSLVSYGVYSQNKTLVFNHISLNEGLPNIPINCIVQDSYGYIWLGTTEGLFKYNGYTFTKFAYSANDSTTIADNFINCIVEDADKNLLIGTNGRGFCVFHRDKNRFERFSHHDGIPTSIINNTVKTIFQDSKGNIWIGTLGGGIDIFDKIKKTFRHLTPAGSAHNVIHVSSFAEDKSGNVWVGRYKGDLCYYKSIQTKLVCITDSVNERVEIEGYLKYLFVDSNNELWIGSNSSGLYRYNINTRQIKHYSAGNSSSSLSSNIITAVQELSPGILAIATNGAGLELFHTDLEKFEHYKYDLTDKNAINSNAIYSICIDKVKNLWLGTSRDGLNISSKNVEKFKLLSAQTNGNNGLSQKSVLALLPLNNETLLIGTDGGGLNIYNRKNKSFQYLRHQLGNEKTIGGNAVKTLFKDSQQNIWVGTYGNGIDQYDIKSNRFYHNAQIPGIPDRIRDANIWNIVEDHDQNIWMGTLGGGLFKYNLKTKQFSQYINIKEKPESISHFQIMCTLVDHKGQLWIGTEDAGLDRYDREQDSFLHFRNDPKNPNSIPSNFIRTLFENSKGELCLGTEGSGVAILKENGTFVSFDTDDGLASNIVYSILEDDRHNLWLGTTKGLSKLNPETGAIKNYSTYNNLQGDLFNMSSCLRTDDGTLFFGGINGFNEINPNEIKDSKIEPHIEITDFKILNKSVKVEEVINERVVLEKSLEMTSAIELSYKDKTISFDFAAIDFSNPQIIRYKYKLEGFDDDWNYVNVEKRSATYTNLPSGKYKFIVMATNGDGVWSKNARTLFIHVAPPFWNTWWFKFLIFLAFALAVTVWYRNRVLKRERELKEERLKAEKEIIKLQKENLEATLANQNSKLTTSILHIGHKNKILQNIKSDLEGFSEDIAAPVKSKYNRLIKSLNKEIDDDESWQQLEMHFNEAHHEFIQRLREKHPDLTKSNLQLCLFIRLNINTKEIADIMNITVRGVEKSRYRLRKKLELSSEASITDYLLSL